MAKAAVTRERILTAAEDVVLRDGVARLTLEAAAAEAGLSKGGVLYHFPTRDALVAAMVRRLVDLIQSELDAARRDDGPGSFTRAYLADTFRPVSGPEQERTSRLGAAVIAAMASESDLLEPLRQGFQAWQANIEQDGIDPGRATIARLAADGLWLNELFGFSFLSSSLRDQIEAELVRFVGGEP
jgi:AcrR family transcriptional regulator